MNFSNTIKPKPMSRTISTTRPNFITDSMLGKLARWLRLLGFDTLYFRCISDDTLLEKAREQQRIVLTCDKELMRRQHCMQVIAVPSSHPSEQLRYLIHSLQLDPHSHLFSRCVHCNRPIHRVAKSSIDQHQVPPHVFATQEVFYRCPACGRYYWAGSHHLKIRNMLAQFGSKES